LTKLAKEIERTAQVLRTVSATYRLDAQVLLAHVLEKPRAWILAHPEHQLSAEDNGKLNRALQELRQGVPLPYVIGHWEFFGLDFQVPPDVLIPRPETELLVEKAIEWLNAHPERRWAVDVGTGSGCIAVALATRVEDLTITASDISHSAVKIAHLNAMKQGVRSRIHLLQANLLPPISTAFDLICANLPYIPSDTLRTLEIHGREPRLALDGGMDGLDMIRRLLEESRYQISPGGCMLLEIEASQGMIVRELATRLFPDGDVRIWPDLAGHERLLEINMIK
jgi:release factor glutamine methyltransferase